MPVIQLLTVVPTATEWLWPGYLAAGHLHLLDGDPNQGKSFMLADLMARLTSGLPWPDGTASPGPAPALLYNGEDRVAATTTARLIAAGADPARVHVWSRAPGEPRAFLPGGINQLRDAIESTGARLVAFDPIQPFFDASVRTGCDANIRAALDPLDELAESTGCAIVMARHLRKSGAARALYGGLGSIGFIAACRIAFLAGTDPYQPDRSVLASNKNNLGQAAPSLAYRINETAGGLAVLEWLGETSWTAADLCRRGYAAGERQARAIKFLERVLKNGPVPSQEVKAAGRLEGLGEKVLRNAAAKLKIKYDQVGSNRHGNKQVHYWLLPDQEAPGAAPVPPTVADWLQRVSEEA